MAWKAGERHADSMSARAIMSPLRRLLRQYLPRGTCSRHVTQAHCDRIADDLNHRPRKRLDFDTPAQLYHRH